MKSIYPTARKKTSENDSAVRSVQKYLNTKGANLDIDGKLGPLTKKSITKYMPKADTGLAPEPDKNTAVQGKEVKERMMPASHFSGTPKNKLGTAAHLKGKMKRPARQGDLVGDAQEGVAEGWINNLLDNTENNEKENQLIEMFETYSDYYKLANGKRIKVDYRQAPNADALPGTIKISYMDQRLKPSMGTSIDQPWDKAPPRIKQAIQQWVAKQPIQPPAGQQGVAESFFDIDDEIKGKTIPIDESLEAKMRSLIGLLENKSKNK